MKKQEIIKFVQGRIDEITSEIQAHKAKSKPDYSYLLVLKGNKEAYCELLSVINNAGNYELDPMFDPMIVLSDNTFEEHEIIENVLLSLGMAPSLKGFTYCCHAIYLLRGKSIRSSLGNKITDLYEEIAEKFGTKASRVERCIRTSIEKSLNENKSNPIVSKLFPKLKYNGLKVTNSEFLNTVTLKLDDIAETL